ncbi:MAG: hypothetical protein ACRC5M_02995, partial [Anaeroplasmataceae bacterium]
LKNKRNSHKLYFNGYIPVNTTHNNFISLKIIDSFLSGKGILQDTKEKQEETLLAKNNLTTCKTLESQIDLIHAQIENIYKYVSRKGRIEKLCIGKAYGVVEEILHLMNRKRNIRTKQYVLAGTKHKKSYLLKTDNIKEFLVKNNFKGALKNNKITSIKSKNEYSSGALLNAYISDLHHVMEIQSLNMKQAYLILTEVIKTKEELKKINYKNAKKVKSIITLDKIFG